MLKDLLVNVSAELISLFIVAIIGLAVSLIFYVRNRRKKLHFFGIKSQRPDMNIFLSRIEIREGGTKGLIPIKRGFFGAAITQLEYEACMMIKSEVDSSLLALFSKEFRDWLNLDNLSLRDLRLKIEVSPGSNREESIDDYLNQNVFIIGSSMYNLLTHYYLLDYFKEKRGWHCFYEEVEVAPGESERIIGVRKINSKGEVITEIPMKGRASGQEVGIIHKFYDAKRKITVFLCFGHSASSTYGSVRYLIKHWKVLQKKCDARGFIICLAFRRQQPNSEIIGPVTKLWSDYEG